MRPPVQIAVGQRWQSRDKRDDGLFAEVIHVSGDGLYDNGFAVIQRHVKTRIRYSTLRSRYQLARPLPHTEPETKEAD